MKTKGRFERAMEIKKELSESLLKEKDLRGLTKLEKNFIRENGYHVEFKQGDNTFYMFIATNNLCKKQLYAISKKQSLCPNGHDINESSLNYCCWLLFNAKKNAFSRLSFELRFSVPPVKFIFAN